MATDAVRSVPDGLSSAAPIEPVPVSPVPASIPSAVEGDMSWFVIAIGCKNTAVILDYSPGWEPHYIEFFWEDTFDIDPPIHLPVGAYLWTGFWIGHWDEDDAINVGGGDFYPLYAQAIEARRDETQSGSVHESAVPQGCAQPQVSETPYDTLGEKA